jgi:hypothetical protein
MQTTVKKRVHTWTTVATNIHYVHPCFSEHACIAFLRILLQVEMITSFVGITSFMFNTFRL